MPITKGTPLPLLLYGLLVLVVIGAVYAAPGQETDVAILAPPWQAPDTAMRLVWRAGGSVTGGGRWPFVVIARSGSPEFVSDLYRSGALLVFNPNMLVGCGSVK